MWKHPNAVLLPLSLLLLVATPCAHPGCQAATNDVSPPVTQESFTEQLLSISLNEQKPYEAMLLRRSDGTLLANAEDLRYWRLRLPAAPDCLYQGKNYYLLDALPGLAYTLNTRDLTLSIASPPERFETTVITAKATTGSVPTPPAPGVFANYDLFGQHVPGQDSLNGLLELGVFNRFGVGVGSVLARDLHDRPQFVRLETTWTIDTPANLSSLRLGDANSRPGTWGRSVRFGGIQWGSNFTTQPGFTPMAAPAVQGEAVVPSILDLYINNARVLRREVPPGPFEIDSLPVVTGQGEVQVFIHDLLGQRQILTQPYYASPRLLRPSLHDYSYELGVVRENFGLESNRYGRAFAAGTHRFGFSEYFTGEGHVEVLPTQQTVGFSGALLWPSGGVFDASLAVSHNDAGYGNLVGLGFERLGRWVSFRLATQLASRDFTRLGQPPTQPTPKWQNEAFVSLNSRIVGSLGLGYIYQGSRRQADIELLTFHFNRHLGKSLALQLSATQNVRDHGYSVFLTFTRALGQRNSITSSVAMQGDTHQVSTQFLHSPPTDNGIGYRFQAVGGKTERVEAGVTLQHDRGTYQLEVAQQRGDTSVQFNVSGGLATLGGHTFFSRRMSDSFAVVAVPGYPGVGVYADNQLMTHTDRNGYALLPRLRPYETNPVRIEVADLPLDAQIDTLEIDAVPFYRSGVLLKFPVRQSHGALLRIMLQDGRPLPTGAMVNIMGHTEDFPVAMNGEVYVTGLASRNRLRATWHDQHCEFEVAFSDLGDPQPRLGDFLCMGMTR